MTNSVTQDGSAKRVVADHDRPEGGCQALHPAGNDLHWHDDPGHHDSLQRVRAIDGMLAGVIGPANHSRLQKLYPAHTTHEDIRDHCRFDKRSFVVLPHRTPHSKVTRRSSDTPRWYCGGFESIAVVMGHGKFGSRSLSFRWGMS